MISAAAIEESALSFVLRCALVGWLCCGLLATVDRRKSALAYQILFSLGTLLLTVRGWAVAEAMTWAWGLAVVVSLVWTANVVRQWLSIDPAELHEESLPAAPRKGRGGKQRRPPVVKRGRQQTEVAPTHPPIIWRPLELAILLVGAMLMLMAVWPFDLLAAKNASLLHVLVVGHLLASCGLLALSVVVAIELSVLSSPDGLSAEPRVAWWSLALWGLGFAVVELLVSLAVLVDLGAPAGGDMLTLDSANSEQLLVQRIFALALTVCAAIAWVIPHRVASYQRRREVPSDWVSLTLASWLACLAMAVVCFLPTGWPLLLG